MSIVGKYVKGGARPMPENQKYDPWLSGTKENPITGEHVLDIESMTLQKSPKGPVVWLKFRVAESASHTVGSRVTHRFALARQSDFPDLPTDAELAVYFLAQTLGLADLGKAEEQLDKLLEEDEKIQRLRGVRVIGIGKANKKLTWVNVTWRNVPQTAVEIKTRRAEISTSAPVAAAPVAAPVAAAAPAAVHPDPEADGFGLEGMFP